MRVLQFNCTNQGSVGKIMSSIEHYLLERGDSSSICHSIGDQTDSSQNRYRVSGKIEPGISRRLGYMIGLQYGLALFSTNRLLRQIKLYQPDIVHLHCPNCNMNVYRLLNYLKKNRICTVITNHCEMFYTANCAHAYECDRWMTGCGNCKHLKEYVGPYWIDGTNLSWKRMQRCFQDFPQLAVTSVSSWIDERSRRSTLLKSFSHYVIENGIAVDKYGYSPDKTVFDQTNGKKKVLFVTAQFSEKMDHNKGGYYLLELARRMQHENVEFYVVGNREPLPCDLPNVIGLGRVDSVEKISRIYAAADLSIVLSRKETFSMPCAESLCSGTPVVGFKAGGPESISIGAYSEFCEYGDVSALARIVREWVHYKEKNDPKQISADAILRYSDSIMVEKYYHLYQMLCHHGGPIRNE